MSDAKDKGCLLLAILFVAFFFTGLIFWSGFRSGVMYERFYPDQYNFDHARRQVDKPVNGN